MKKTLFLLLATAALSTAETEDVQRYELTSYNISFGNGSTLTTYNEAMNWKAGERYDNWFITFELPYVNKEDYYYATIAAGASKSDSTGLSASAKTGYITLGSGKNAVYADTIGSIDFSSTDTLTFAFYNGTAYLGNLNTQKYISYTPTGTWDTTTRMTSGSSRAWSNGGNTQIGNTTIASLDEYTGKNLDMAILMTTGVAQGKAAGSGDGEGTDTPITPPTTSGYYIHTHDITTAWTDKQDYTLSAEAKVTTASSLPVYFKYYNNAADAAAAPDKKLVLALGDSSQENGFVDLGGINISNGVIVYSGATALLPGQSGGSGYAPDNPDARPQTFSYGILELATGAFVKLGALDNGNNPIDSITRGWSYVGSLQLKENARLTIDSRQLAVTGQPYTSLEKGARIDVLPGAVISFGASNENSWDAVVMNGINKGTGVIINTSDTTAELGTPTAGNVEFRDMFIKTQGHSDMTIAAKLGNVNLYANSTRGTTSTITLTGGVAEGYTMGIKQLRTGDQFSSARSKVFLHNRGESVQLDSLIVGKYQTVGARQAGADSDVSEISISAYNPELQSADFPDLWATNGLHTYLYAELEANLSLGIEDMTKSVAFAPTIDIVAYGTSNRDSGYGINMLGNDVHIIGNVVMNSYYTQEQSDEMEILLFTNVDALTLGNTVYDDRYFDYNEQVAAADFFSSDGLKPNYFSSFNEPTGEEDNLTGWFIEYRDNGQNDGTGDVYLAYHKPKMDAVPEPTTATLSLLALAAIAARRRRK